MPNRFLDRWNDTHNLLRAIAAITRGTQGNLADLRGLPYGSEEVRKDLREVDLSWVDLSYASFEECNFFRVRFSDCLFRNVNFTELRQWNCEYVNCIFEKANFSNATLGVNTLFEGCIFKSCKLKGKYFNFGTQNLFKNSEFIECIIQSAWIGSVRFEGCAFSSRFTNIRFSGSKEASVDSDPHAHPATLIDCDLGKSFFRGVEIMDGAIFKNSILPHQPSERFNNDRICYE